MAIIKAVCCENLSDTEAAMVFGCSVEDIHFFIHDAMKQTGYKNHELWQVIGVPHIPNFNVRRRTEPIGAAEKIMHSRVETKNAYFSRVQV
jgi:hypothetical protein